jgi:hypothetical protein
MVTGRQHHKHLMFWGELELPLHKQSVQLFAACAAGELVDVKFGSFRLGEGKS